MLIAFAIFFAIIVGAWAGIAFDYFVWDAVHDDVESFGFYAARPWQTLQNVWSVIAE